MMDPKQRIALALQYQQKKPDPFDAVPVAGIREPSTPNEMTWLDRLNNLSAGLGKGIEGQLEGYKQLITDPIQSAKDTVQALGTMVRNPSVIADALKGMAEKATSGSQGLGEVVGENMTLNPRKLAMALAHPKVAELTVYHGTPHTFPAAEGAPLGKFDASKIGTGEGAQAYGHGIYVAESPDVAKSYIASGGSRSGAADAYAADIVGMMGGEQKALDHLKHILPKTGENTFTGESKEFIEKAIENIKSGAYKSNAGSLYTVDLPDEHIEKMLDWDKPFKQQPTQVKNAILDIVANDGNSRSENGLKSFVREFGSVAEDSYMGNVYNALSKKMGGKVAASEVLRQAGIPGIKYFDAGSRDVGKGTRNFVIFPGEEHNLKILERK